MYLCVHAYVFARGCARMCVCPTISATRAETGRTCWPSPISHAPCFLVQPHTHTHHPRAPAGPRISLWSPHSAYSLSSVCLPVPHSSATSAFGLFGQESPPPAAYNNKPTLVTVSESVRLCERGKKKEHLWGRGRAGCEKVEARVKVIQ